MINTIQKILMFYHNHKTTHASLTTVYIPEVFQLSTFIFISTCNLEEGRRRKKEGRRRKKEEEKVEERKKKNLTATHFFPFHNDTHRHTHTHTHTHTHAQFTPNIIPSSQTMKSTKECLLGENNGL